MAMKKMLLTTYWSPSEVHNVLEFLNELQAVIKVNYANELDQFYRESTNEDQQKFFGFEDDIIPF